MEVFPTRISLTQDMQLQMEEASRRSKERQNEMDHNTSHKMAIGLRFVLDILHMPYSRKRLSAAYVARWQLRQSWGPTRSKSCWELGEADVPILHNINAQVSQ